MKARGDVDPDYENAREALMDALDALRGHLDALVLVGAQAVYQYTGASDLDIAEYTTDADFSIDPELLSDEPVIATIMTAAHFTATKDPGHWLSPTGVAIDLMVPERLAGPGRRGARLSAHGNSVARRARGLEASLVDKQRRTISSLRDPRLRQREIWVAGPAALVVAKVIKIAERMDETDRLRDKDALDIYRLLRSVNTNQLVDSIQSLLVTDVSAVVTEDAMSQFNVLFATPSSRGTVMAGRATGLLTTESTVVRESMSLLANDLLDGLDR